MNVNSEVVAKVGTGLAVKKVLDASEEGIVLLGGTNGEETKLVSEPREYVKREGNDRVSDIVKVAALVSKMVGWETGVEGTISVVTVSNTAASMTSLLILCRAVAVVLD